MMNTKDCFISYGRRESLLFVGRLHKKMKLAGYEVWFDKVNILHAEAYDQRISNGIESAHNFVYIMAPRCMTSPYCLIELEYARALGKRVIPINQLAIFDCAPKPLSQGDVMVMKGFYRRNKLPDLEILTEKDVLARTHELLGTSDWIYGRENFTEADALKLTQWAVPYENYWKQHEDPTYLQNFEFPIIGEAIDDFDAVFRKVQDIFDRHKTYVEAHTQILLQALLWEAKGSFREFLPVGEIRKSYEKWLLTPFIAPEQPPCKPTFLHTRFIVEARKNAENLMTDVFINHNDSDVATMEAFYRALSRHNITCWLSSIDLENGRDVQEQINAGIENADNFIFFITKESLTSSSHLKNLNYALQMHKRILLIKTFSHLVTDLPAQIQNFPYIDLTDNHTEEDFLKDIAEILTAIKLEREYYYNHKRYLVTALRWTRQKNNDAVLLRGHNLEQAKIWLEQGQRAIHPPTKLHSEFIEQSFAKKGLLENEIFISYSRKDADFARKINFQLQSSGKTCWFDQESIPLGVDFDSEILYGIENSHIFLFILSPNSISSPFCITEVEHALKMGKRILTILYQEINPSELPQGLKNIQWINFLNSENFSSSFSELIRTLEVDRDFVAMHTKWQNKALDWEKNKKDSALLLKGSEYILASDWLKEAQLSSKNSKKSAEITALQKEFIIESGNTIAQAKKKDVLVRRLLIGLSLFSVLGSFLLLFVLYKVLDLNAETFEKNLVDIHKDAQTEAHLKNYSTAIKLCKSGISQLKSTPEWWEWLSRKQVITESHFNEMIDSYTQLSKKQLTYDEFIHKGNEFYQQGDSSLYWALYYYDQAIKLEIDSIPKEKLFDMAVPLKDYLKKCTQARQAFRSVGFYTEEEKIKKDVERILGIISQYPDYPPIINHSKASR